MWDTYVVNREDGRKEIIDLDLGDLTIIVKKSFHGYIPRGKETANFERVGLCKTS